MDGVGLRCVYFLESVSQELEESRFAYDQVFEVGSKTRRLALGERILGWEVTDYFAFGSHTSLLTANID